MTQAVDIDIKEPVIDTTSKASSTSGTPSNSDSDSSLDVSILKLNGQSAFGNERELEAFYEPCEGYVSIILFLLEFTPSIVVILDEY